MNIVLAFVILVGIVLSVGTVVEGAPPRIERIDRKLPAQGLLYPGDQLLAVDGRRGNQIQLSEQINEHRCTGRLRPGCRAETPVRLLIRRDGRDVTIRVWPVYDGKERRMRVGFQFGPAPRRDVGLLEASGVALGDMWRFTSGTVSTLAQIFKPEKREEISGVVGSYEVTRQAVELDATMALYILAVISLSLGVINLFPFLPLDGGHIFWALAEKVRRRPIAFSTLERAGFVGFALVLFLFVIGLSNDIGRLTGEGFGLR